jgi:hypothetical protein
MAAMTEETQAHLREMGRAMKTLTAETESALSQSKRASREIRIASSRITWKMGLGMLLAGTLAAPAAVSAYVLWQRHYGEEKAQAEAWQSFRVQTNSLAPAERGRLFKILHWDQGR